MVKTNKRAGAQIAVDKKLFTNQGDALLIGAPLPNENSNKNIMAKSYKTDNRDKTSAIAKLENLLYLKVNKLSKINTVIAPPIIRKRLFPPYI